MLKRRRFVKSAIVLSAATCIPENVLSQFPKTKIDPTVILAKKLKKGNTVGLIAPGYAISEENLEKAKKTITNMGLVPYCTDRISQKYGYFSNTDQERANDLNEMFANPKIDAIICARGGYGCTRIMPMIDFENIKNNPKILVGFSDVTALLNGIYKETGVISFHGPVGSTLDDVYTISQLEQVLMHPKKHLVIGNAVLEDDSKEKPEYERYVITPGMATGKLVGGNLTLINALIGTPYEIDFTNALVCIEDVEEAPYRIDRMLTQLMEGKTFKKAAGIVFGVCAGCNSPSNSDSFSLKEVVLDRIKPLEIPAVYGMSFGHVKNNFTFPIGMEAILNTGEMTLQLLEKAVR